jgi:Zinc finger C-x8-C-x5-C-x3-H type (and similar)
MATTGQSFGPTPLARFTHQVIENAIRTLTTDYEARRATTLQPSTDGDYHYGSWKVGYEAGFAKGLKYAVDNLRDLVRAQLDEHQAAKVMNTPVNENGVLFSSFAFKPTFTSDLQELRSSLDEASIPPTPPSDMVRRALRSGGTMLHSDDDDQPAKKQATDNLVAPPSFSSAPITRSLSAEMVGHSHDSEGLTQPSYKVPTINNGSSHQVSRPGLPTGTITSLKADFKADDGVNPPPVHWIYDRERGTHHINLRYKTGLCTSFHRSGACEYGSQCQFAHGAHELRPPMQLGSMMGANKDNTPSRGRGMNRGPAADSAQSQDDLGAQMYAKGLEEGAKQAAESVGGAGAKRGPSVDSFRGGNGEYTGIPGLAMGGQDTGNLTITSGNVIFCPFFRQGACAFTNSGTRCPHGSHDTRILSNWRGFAQGAGETTAYLKEGTEEQNAIPFPNFQ